MKCRIGDRVRFLNDVGGGVVKKLIDANRVIIETDEGFEIPLKMNDLIVITQKHDKLLSNQEEDPENNSANYLTHEQTKPNFELTDKKDVSTKVQTENDRNGSEINLSIAFTPDNQHYSIDKAYQMFIINDSCYQVFYVISLKQLSILSPLKNGLLTPYVKEYVRSFSLNELHEILILNAQAIFFKDNYYVSHQPLDVKISIDPVSFRMPDAFIKNKFFETKVKVFSLTSESGDMNDYILNDFKNISSLNKVTIKEEGKSGKSIKNINEEVEEVDLHIEVLVENPSELKPGEILEIQLARFETAITGAIKGKTRKMVFIHGIGNGKLKHEIRKQLESKYSKLKYQDASFKEYGYGATIVYLR